MPGGPNASCALTVHSPVWSVAGHGADRLLLEQRERITHASQGTEPAPGQRSPRQRTPSIVVLHLAARPARGAGPVLAACSSRWDVARRMRTRAPEWHTSCCDLAHSHWEHAHPAPDDRIAACTPEGMGRVGCWHGSCDVYEGVRRLLRPLLRPC